VSKPMSEPAPLTCQLRVASTNDDSIAAYVRRHRLEIGQPLTFDEKYLGVTALETFAGAFAADIINGLRRRAKKRRLEVGEVEGVVKVWLENPLAFLEVVGETGTPSICLLRLQLYISTAEPEASVRVLLAETLARSPLYLTLSKAAKVEVNFQLAI